MLQIDGITYDVRCDVERLAELKASDISGLMLDGSYFNDVLGTYLSYDLTFTYPLRDRDKYAALFEVLTAPVDAHAFVLPYNHSTVSLTARVTGVSDRLITPLPGARTYWKATKFSIIANHPTKAQTLAQALTRGRAPLPEVASPEIGDAYTYTAGGWVATPTYADADAMSF